MYIQQSTKLYLPSGFILSSLRARCHPLRKTFMEKTLNAPCTFRTCVGLALGKIAPFTSMSFRSRNCLQFLVKLTLLVGVLVAWTTGGDMLV